MRSPYVFERINIFLFVCFQHCLPCFSDTHVGDGVKNISPEFCAFDGLVTRLLADAAFFWRLVGALLGWMAFLLTDATSAGEWTFDLGVRTVGLVVTEENDKLAK